MKKLSVIIILLFVFFVFIPSLATQGNRFDITVLNSTLLNLFVFVLGVALFFRFRFLPQVQSIRFILPVSIACIVINFLVILVSRLQYSIKVTLIGSLLLPLCLLIMELVLKRAGSRKLCLIPSGKGDILKSEHGYEFITLSKPSLPDFSINGLVVDFRDNKISDEWERLLVHATFNKIPVYSFVQIKESLTGQVDLNFLEENDIGGLQPSAFVSGIKRVVDLTFVLITLPIVIPIGLFISLAIFFDSPGGIFFKQKRVGLDGISFNMIKFRSMSSRDTKSETKHADQRVTKIGAILRKYRLDEIPQFINILLGNMSLIGPRPETIALVEEYDKKIPFFMYRHVVKPGISGWAQVMLGYTVGADEKRDKLAYDLYYVKHYSLWLDLLIWFKTIKTIFSGCGAR